MEFFWILDGMSLLPTQMQTKLLPKELETSTLDGKLIIQISVFIKEFVLKNLLDRKLSFEYLGLVILTNQTTKYSHFIILPYLTTIFNDQICTLKYQKSNGFL